MNRCDKESAYPTILMEAPKFVFFTALRVVIHFGHVFVLEVHYCFLIVVFLFLFEAYLCREANVRLTQACSART